MNIGHIYYINGRLSNLKWSSAMNKDRIRDLRKTTEILVIDDEGFNLLSDISKQGFNMHHKKDIDSIKDLEAYDIVLSDIRGVGKVFQSEYDGAYLIKEAKINYPNKQVIAYTASTYDPNYNKFLSYADAIIPKGTSIEDWVSLLDEQLIKCIDPVFQWNKLRVALFSAGMDTIEVAQIESLYVKAIEKKSFESLEKLKKTHDNPQIRYLVFELLSSLMVKFITGGI